MPLTVYETIDKFEFVMIIIFESIRYFFFISVIAEILIRVPTEERPRNLTTKCVDILRPCRCINLNLYICL